MDHAGSRNERVSSRRDFLLTTAAGVVGLWSMRQRLQAAGLQSAARRAADAQSLRVTEIETHEILLPYHDSPGYDNPVVTDFRADRESDKFQRLWNETRDGPVVIE